MSGQRVDPVARYVELVEALRDHLRGVRGWQAKAARALRTHPTMVSKLARGARSSVGIGSIEAAVENGVPADLFFTSQPFTKDILTAVLQAAESEPRSPHGGRAMIDGYERGLGSVRYRVLVEELGARMKRTHGWKARAAELLGVTPGYVSKVLAGKATEVTASTAMRAIRSLRIDPAFFTDPDATLKLGELPALPEKAHADGDAELAAMQTLIDLDEPARARVLAWAIQRWGQP